jgi:uncharacterized damage-inducible protein DinB
MADVLADRFRKWFDYEREVHAKVVASLETVPVDRRASPEFKKAVGWLAHLATARRVWLERLGIAPAGGATTLFPSDLELAQVVATLNEVQARWTTYLAGITDLDLARSVDYKSIDAGRFRNRVDDILTQLFGHSLYHRGQIATLVRAAGGEPAITDYIFYCREPIDGA